MTQPAAQPTATKAEAEQALADQGFAFVAPYRSKGIWEGGHWAHADGRVGRLESIPTPEQRARVAAGGKMPAADEPRSGWYLRMANTRGSLPVAGTVPAGF